MSGVGHRTTCYIPGLCMPEFLVAHIPHVLQYPSPMDLQSTSAFFTYIASRQTVNIHSLFPSIRGCDMHILRGSKVTGDKRSIEVTTKLVFIR